MSEAQEEKPDVITITAKGQVTIPSRLRKRYELEEGDQLMVVPIEDGLMLKKIELPSVEEFRERVASREVDLSLEDIAGLVREHRDRR